MDNKYSSSCIFCKIIQKELKSYIIFENKQFMVILDLFPRNEGHILLLPKVHYSNLINLPKSFSINVIPTIQELVNLLEKKLNIKGFNIILNDNKISGQEIPHIHFHIIPKYKEDDFTIKFHKKKVKKLIDLKKVFDKIKS